MPERRGRRLLKHTLGGRWSLRDSEGPPGGSSCTSPSRHWQRADAPCAPPRVTEEAERGPPRPTCRTGGKGATTGPALSYASRPVPIHTDTKILVWASRFASSGKLVTDFRSHSTPIQSLSLILTMNSVADPNYTAQQVLLACK